MESEMNSTGASDHICVRVYVSIVSFSVLLFFNLIITWTIVSEPSLRRHARFVLLLQLLVSALLHLGTSSLFYLLIHLRARPVRTVCLAMISVLISSASNILLTLTVMALDRFCAVCHPLRYSSAPYAGRWAWILGMLTWVVSLLIPVSVLFQDQEDTHQEPGECGRQQLRKGGLQKVVFITVCTIIILYSYTRILMEGRKLGLLTMRNQAGCRTIALHGTQLAVYILPNFVNFALTSLNKRGAIQRDAKELWAVVSFTFFSLAQCVAPVVYGLRKAEILEQLGHRFPCCVFLKRLLGWTGKHHPNRERTLTGQTIVSLRGSTDP